MPRIAGLAQRRGGGGGGGTSFLGLTSWSRPAFTPTRTVNFTNKAQLDSAISGLAAGDLIQYTGSGVLTITQTGDNNAYNLSGKNPTGVGAVIDFGTHLSIWDPSRQSGNYVAFSYTGTFAGDHAFFIHNCSNLRIYGGDFSNSYHGEGILAYGHLDNVQWWDFYSHDCGGDTIGILPTYGTPKDITNCNWRGELTKWGGNLSSPSWDVHTEKGTGIHGAQICDAGNGGKYLNNTHTFYAHDCLCGGAVQFGGEVGEDQIDGNVFYLRAEHLSKVATSQVAGETLATWGGIKMSNTTIPWIEGTDLQGPVLIAAESVTTQCNDWVVSHGRHTNTNQNSFLGTDPYDLSVGITYNDCT